MRRPSLKLCSLKHSRFHRPVRKQGSKSLEPDQIRLMLRELMSRPEHLSPRQVVQMSILKSQQRPKTLLRLMPKPKTSKDGCLVQTWVRRSAVVVVGQTRMRHERRPLTHLLDRTCDVPWIEEARVETRATCSCLTLPNTIVQTFSVIIHRIVAMTTTINPAAGRTETSIGSLPRCKTVGTQVGRATEAGRPGGMVTTPRADSHTSRVDSYVSRIGTREHHDEAVR